MRSPSLLPFATLLALGVGSPDPLPAQGACPPGRTALVLAGGGAKGFVHIGVIRMLDSLGIRPDFIVGTSMGAIVGALYASGYSSRELDHLARSVPFAELVRPRTQASSRAYTLFRPLIYWEIEDARIHLTRAAVPEQGVDAALNSALLRGNLQARGDFGRLPIPFYAVATDLATQRPVALHKGDLAQAVRASMAIPLVFEPVRIGDRTFADGGLAANLPVRLARDLGASRVIISDLVRRQTTVVDFGSPLIVATALIDYLFSQAGDSALAGDVLIETDVTGLWNLDFAPATLDTLVQRGERAARAPLIAGLDCLPRPAPRLVPPASAPERVTKLTVSELGRVELTDLLGTLGLAEGETLEPGVLRRGFEHLAADGRFRSVWLNPTSHDSGVALDLRVRRAPAGGLGLGLAYDNELGARMWGGAVLRDSVTRAFEMTGIVTFGGLRRDLQAASRRQLYIPGRPSLLAAAHVGQEQIPRFAPDGTPLARSRLSFAALSTGLEWAVGKSWLVRLAGEARAWSDTNDMGHEALGGTFAAQRAVEDGDILSVVELQLTRQFQRAALEWKHPITAGRWTVTPGLRVGSVQGDEIPPLATFALGGTEGFPGLHLLERRGEHEAMVTTALTYQLEGQLRLRAEVAAGDARADTTGAPRRLFGAEGWLVGWRLGVGLRASPFGPIRLEYGATSIQGDYRDQVFLRVGRWF